MFRIRLHWCGSTLLHATCNVISEAQRCFTARNRYRYSSILEALFVTQGIETHKDLRKHDARIGIIGIWLASTNQGAQSQYCNTY